MVLLKEKFVNETLKICTFSDIPQKVTIFVKLIFEHIINNFLSMLLVYHCIYFGSLVV
jgi:hypothetical protein